MARSSGRCAEERRGIEKACRSLGGASQSVNVNERVLIDLLAAPRKELAQIEPCRSGVCSFGVVAEKEIQTFQIDENVSDTPRVQLGLHGLDGGAQLVEVDNLDLPCLGGARGIAA